MRVVFVIIGLMLCCITNCQHYYVTNQNDTIECFILDEWPKYIRIKQKDSKKDRISPDEMKCYLGTNVIMGSKRIINQSSKDSLILLPLYPVENEIRSKNFEIKIIKGNGLTFYEVKTYEKFVEWWLKHDSRDVYIRGRDFKEENFIENDSIGLSKIKYLTNPDDEQQKLDAINSVYFYLMDNKEIEQKLSMYGDYRNFTERG